MLPARGIVGMPPGPRAADVRKRPRTYTYHIGFPAFTRPTYVLTRNMDRCSPVDAVRIFTRCTLHYQLLVANDERAHLRVATRQGFLTSRSLFTLFIPINYILRTKPHRLMTPSPGKFKKKFIRLLVPHLTLRWDRPVDGTR